MAYADFTGPAASSPHCREGAPRPGTAPGDSDVEGGDPAQIATMPGVVEAPRPVHGGAVVPDHEVTDPPDMAIDELRPGGVLGELAQEQATFGDRAPEDVAGVRGQVQGTAAGARDGAHERMNGAAELGPLVLRELEAEERAR